MIPFWVSLVLMLAAAGMAARSRWYARRARADWAAARQLRDEARGLVRQTAAHQAIRAHRREN